MSTPAPVISNRPPYQKPESGEGRRQPWPVPSLVGVVTGRAERSVLRGSDMIPFSSQFEQWPR
jgi:hypothetical protein